MKDIGLDWLDNVIEKRHKICKGCNSIIIPGKDNKNYYRQKYCNKQCMINHRKFIHLSTSNCKQCGKKLIYSSNLRLNRQKYCNRKCYTIFRTKNHNRYILIQNKEEKILEHRKVMEKKIGRKLTKKETVHHKNGFKSDNNENNLELWAKDHPAGQRVEDKLKWALEFIQQYRRKDNISSGVLSFGC